MRRIAPVILISLCCCGSTVVSVGQTRNIDSPEVLKPLLALPAPVPRNAAVPLMEGIQIQPPTFYAKENTPPDDAPIDDLINYWQRWAHNGSHRPSETVGKRLLDACFSDPKLLNVFLNLFPDTDKSKAKIKEIYDKELANPELDQIWRDSIKRWLVFNSKYFLDELVAIASKAKENEKSGEVDKEEALKSLANLSWPHAESLVRGLLASGHPRATALALSLFYEHAMDEDDTIAAERYRRDLQAIATNRSQPGYARETAIDALAFSDWSGRNEWYIGLFQDESLLNAIDGEFRVTPLSTLVIAKPDEWIPILARLVESKDPTVKSAAAACLITSINLEPRKEAIVPLLPWLTNPSWANDAGGQRLQFIRSLGNIDVPESVPGLISIVENEDTPPTHARSYAAEALARYEDPRAAPALKRALAKEKDENQRHRLFKGLVASHGLTEKEQVDALEEYAARLQTTESREDVWRYRQPHEEPLPISISIARYLTFQREVPDALIAAVLARVEQLKSENPALAKSLVEVAHQWQGTQVELDMIARIANGSADSTVISQALQRKQKMQETLRSELQGLSSAAGATQGVGAVLLNDPALAQEILTSKDRPAQIALLMCSRLTQTALPVELVGPFLRHKDSLLASAAEAYLLAEDSPEAQQLLWQRHPNEAFVTGWREALYYGASYFERLSKNEDKLRAELLKENGPTEIVAFVQGFQDQSMVLRIYADKAVYTEYEDAARYRDRQPSKAEVSAFKDYLTMGAFAARGPMVNYCHHGCPVAELMMLTKEKGRRVFSHGGDWRELQEQFAQLASGEGMKIHYTLEDEIKGLEVLYAGELTVNDVAQQGGELRILVERPATKEEEKEREATYEYDEDQEDEENLLLLRSRRRVELQNARFSWRVFANDKVGAITSKPDLYSTFDVTKFMVDDEFDMDWEDGISDYVKVVNADEIIITPYGDGLWRQFAGSKAVRIGTEEASYGYPIVSHDRKWVIAPKSEESSEPNFIIRLNLQTGREYRVNLPPSHDFEPLVSLPSGKVLLRRATEQAKEQKAIPGNPTTAPPVFEYYLLDPATGATRLVTGDFTPLQIKGDRFLQSTDNPDEYWAALSDEKKNQTQIGRYSLKDFSFKPVMIAPRILFDSTSMWVDAAQSKIYVVYKGQLLRLPLQAAAK